MGDSATVLIRGENADLDAALKESTGSVESFGSGVKKMLTGIAVFIAARKVFDWGAGFVEAFNEASEVERKLISVLDKSGKIGGKTKEELGAIADKMQDLTVHDDEAVSGAQTMLAVFRNIQGVNFERTLQTAADLSAVMGGDLQSNAEKLGRALNRPGEGMRALTQMGIAFTKQQKEQIKVMVESGDIAGAQKIILDQLADRFGGAASKATETFSGKVAQLKNRLGNMAEEIGGKLVPILEKLMPRIEILAQFLSDYVVPAVISVIDTLFEWGKAIYEFVKPALEALLEVGLYVFTGIQTVVENFGDVFKITFLSIALAAVKTFEVLKHWLTVAIPEYLRWFRDNWKAIWNDTISFLKTIISNMWENIKNFWDSIKDLFKGKGFTFEWTPLLKGFEATVKALPKIAEREMGPLERSMEAQLDKLTRKVSRSFQDNMAANRRALGMDGGEDVQPVGSNSGAEPGTPAYYKAQKEREQREMLRGIGGAGDTGGFSATFEGLADLNRRITTAARSSPEDKIVAAVREQGAQELAVAKENRDNTKKVADMLPEVIDAVGNAGALQ